MKNILPITVGLSYYNDKKYIAASIESILDQSYENFELVLCNHASTDGSRDIAVSYKDPRIIHIDLPKNLGAGSSYNFRYSKDVLSGIYFKNFAADDVMHKDCLKNLIEYAEEHPEKDLVFGNLEYINAKGKKLGKNWFGDIKNFSKDFSEIDLMRIFASGSNVLPCSAAFMKTEKLKRIKFDNSMTIRADMWLWLSFLLSGAKVGFCDKIVGSYRFHEYQESFFDSEVLQRRSEMEKAPFLSLFFQIDNVETAKMIFPDSPYADRLTDVQDIPFFVAESFLRKNKESFAYHALFNMMLDEQKLKRLENVFGFGVLELRKLYAFKDPHESFKQRIYAKKPRKLTTIELLYLLWKRSFRFLRDVMTLRFLRKRKI